MRVNFMGVDAVGAKAPLCFGHCKTPVESVRIRAVRAKQPDEPHLDLVALRPSASDARGRGARRGLPTGRGVPVELVALQHEGDGVDVAVVTRDDEVAVGLGHEIEFGHRQDAPAASHGCPIVAQWQIRPK